MSNTVMVWLTPMIRAGIDYLVLGCTHYSFLRSQIQAILPAGVQIIDAADAVAKQTKNILDQRGLLSQVKSIPNFRFYTNKDLGVLESFLGSLSADKTIAKVDF